jgi:hypothetical protein
MDTMKSTPQRGLQLATTGCHLPLEGVVSNVNEGGAPLPRGYPLAGCVRELIEELGMQ